MKKAKLVFIAVALLAGIGGAFATRPDPGCEASPQYFWNGASYQGVPGAYGVGWYCEYDASFACSFYRPNPMQPVYHMCRVGIFRTVF